MKTRNQHTQQTDLFEQFEDNQLDHSEMFAVRGGDNDGGSHADVQEDGFN